jgi:hypothetical protein
MGKGSLESGKMVLKRDESLL